MSESSTNARHEYQDAPGVHLLSEPIQFLFLAKCHTRGVIRISAIPEPTMHQQPASSEFQSLASFGILTGKTMISITIAIPTSVANIFPKAAAYESTTCCLARGFRSTIPRIDALASRMIYPRQYNTHIPRHYEWEFLLGPCLVP